MMGESCCNVGVDLEQLHISRMLSNLSSSQHSVELRLHVHAEDHVRRARGEGKEEEHPLDILWRLHVEQ